MKDIEAKRMDQEKVAMKERSCFARSLMMRAIDFFAS